NAIRTTTTKHDVADLGAGEKILGHATHRYRVTTDFTMEMTAGGKTCSRATSSVSEMWIAPDLDLSSPMRMAMGSFGLGDEPDAERSSTAGAQQLPKGLPLRTVIRSTSRDASGAPRTVTTTMEYTEI